jgi:sigma-B regulation protein RsbU (phosphoserine phosphatase)
LWASLGGRFGYGFVTAFYLVLYPAEHTVRFAGAGHPSPLLLRRREGRVEPLVDRPRMTGQALLLQPHPVYTTHEIALSPGDAIMMFTDGIYEVRGDNRETYGIDRLQALMARHVDEPLPTLFQRIVSEALAFSSDNEFQDDVCMLGVELANSAPTPSASAE